MPWRAADGGPDADMRARCIAFAKEEMFRQMLEKEDQKLKAEIDAIMDNVETIMGRVESVVPAGKKEEKPKKESN